MTRNDERRSTHFILFAQAVVFGLLLWIGWQVRGIRSLAEPPQVEQPMLLVFEWDTEDGRQRLETPRDPGESFLEFWDRHQHYIELALQD